MPHPDWPPRSKRCRSNTVLGLRCSICGSQFPFDSDPIGAASGQGGVGGELAVVGSAAATSRVMQKNEIAIVFGRC